MIYDASLEQNRFHCNSLGIAIIHSSWFGIPGDDLTVDTCQMENGRLGTAINFTDIKRLLADPFMFGEEQNTRHLSLQNHQSHVKHFKSPH